MPAVDEADHEASDKRGEVLEKLTQLLTNTILNFIDVAVNTKTNSYSIVTYVS